MEAILSRQRNKFLAIDTSLYQHIIIRQKHLWEDSIHCFRSGIDFQKHLRVTFVGEPAVDAGGPLHEFLHLLMREIATNNSLFSGEETCRVPLPNMSALERQVYRHVGEMMAVSLVHGGPAPTFFAPSVVDYIVHGINLKLVRSQMLT